MTIENILALAALAAGVIYQYIKSSNDMARLKERLYQLEKREVANDSKLAELYQAITRIEKALVKAGLINIE